MALPISMDPCENLNARVDQKTGELEQKGVKLKSQIEKFRQDLLSHVEPPSAQEELDNAIAAATVDDINAGTTAITQIRNFTGTCFDQIYYQSRKFAAEIDHYVSDGLDDITSFIALPEYNLLKPLQQVRSALGAEAIEALVAEIDESLGCLSEQGSELGECLSIIDNFNDRVDDVLRYLGLGEQGEFSLSTFTERFGITMNPTTQSNLEALDTKTESLKTEAVQNVVATFPGNINPAAYF
jgi:hypothetical protein